MDKQQMLDTTKEVLTPFETENMVTYFRTLTLDKALHNPWLIGIFLIIFFYAAFKRSKTVLLFLFTVVALATLLRFTLPPAGEELTLSSMLPLALGALGIGGTIIYFTFIKGD